MNIDEKMLRFKSQDGRTVMDKLGIYETFKYLFHNSQHTPIGSNSSLDISLCLSAALSNFITQYTHESIMIHKIRKDLSFTLYVLYALLKISIYGLQ